MHVCTSFTFSRSAAMDTALASRLFSFTVLDELVDFATNHAIIDHPYTQSCIFKLKQKTCKTCNKTFSNQQNCKTHEQRCKKRKSCPYCHELFSNSVFEKHIKKCLTCKTCKVRFNSSSDLSSHECSFFNCEYCDKAFNSQSNCNRHVKCCMRRPRCAYCKKFFTSCELLSSHKCALACQNCNSFFFSKIELCKHLSTCKTKCNTCSTIFASKTAFNKHKCIQKSVNTEVRCSRCGYHCPSRRALNLHIREKHLMRGGSNHQPEPRFDDAELQECFTQHRSYIYDHHEPGQPLSFYNFPLDSSTFTLEALTEMTQRIYDNQAQAFKINLSFGLILQNINTNEYRYFRAYSNDALLPSPVLISSRQDLDKLADKFKEMDIHNYLLKARPNTHWKPVLITNVRFYVTNIGFPLGSPITLPDYIKNRKCIMPLQSSFKGRFSYDDNLCLFRCLAVSLQGRELYKTEKKLQQATLSYYRKFCEYMQDEFAQGVALTYFPDVEKCFQININAFSLAEDDSAMPVYKSLCNYSHTMNVNVYNYHLSLILDLQKYCKKYKCVHCEKLFKTNTQCARHQRNCSLAVKYSFPGGYYHLSSGIFEDLEVWGIFVDNDDRFYDYFAVFDFEAYLKKLSHNDTDKTNFTQEHYPISVALASNVPGYEEGRCFVNADPDELVKSMLEYLREIQLSAKELLDEKLNYVREALDAMVLYWEEQDTEDTHLYVQIMKKKIEQISNRFDLYCAQLPVLGFNSAKYDLNLVKRYICRHLYMHEDEHAYTIKKNNAYFCIANEHFRFLDITNFLAAGSSYSSFLKAFDIAENKGFFPYSYLDHPDKLNDTQLPPYEDFFSDLKGENVLGKPENYAIVQNIWRENNMQTFKDFLRYYNLLDVLPFVQAVSKLQDLYKVKQVDMFKIAISVPGIARQLLYKCATENNAKFALIDNRNKDLFFTIQNNLVGGPSIIFNREVISGVTKIRQGEKTAERVIGFDANSLYLYCFSLDFPTGSFIRRKAENGFKPVFNDSCNDMFDWMDFVAQRENIKIHHKRNNNNKEKRIGRFFADGYCNSTVYEYDGCFIHQHENCALNTSDTNTAQSRAKRNRREHRNKYYQRLGYNVVTIWECEYEKMKKNSPELRKFLQNRRASCYKRYKNTLTEQEIIDGVLSGELFGMLEVDICIPSQWEGSFKKDISPAEYFSEMAPLFCTTQVKFDDVGEHMQQHIIKYGLSQNPRTLLVGGVKAERIMLASHLLKWYIEHGLRVTKIYQVVEYTAKRCFVDFVSEITTARRAGDISKDKSLFADLNKILANSAFGSCAINKMSHAEVKYVEGEENACREANSKLFKKMMQLDENYDFYEVEKMKKKIVLDSPAIIAYYVLQYAKLRILQFYYDFLDVYVDRENYMLCQMDTDSVYFAIAGQNLKDVIKLEYQEKFNHCLQGFCNVDEVEADDEYHWLPRECCKKHNSFDQRTPGLFKLEHEGGLDFIGLASKTYVVRNSDKQKFSCKGISKKRIIDPFALYQKVLSSGDSIASRNAGFLAKNNTVYTYQQERNGFAYLYVKRRVLQDGVSTTPLDITLKPRVKYSQLC